jgi:hypothetical protein
MGEQETEKLRDLPKTSCCQWNDMPLSSASVQTPDFGPGFAAAALTSGIRKPKSQGRGDYIAFIDFEGEIAIERVIP